MKRTVGLQITLPLWRDLPGEIIEDVMKWLVAGCYVERKAYNATSLSKVCHEWRRHFLPFLARHLEINRWESFEGVNLVSSFRLTRRVCCYTASLSLQNVQNMTPTVIRELTVLLPNLDRLAVSEISWDQERSHPLSGKIFTWAWSGFAHVSHLRLHDCTFNDSSDVLRLLAALPELTSVELSQIVCIRTSQVIPNATRNHLTKAKVQTNTTLAPSRCRLSHGSMTLNMSPYIYHLWALPHPGKVIKDALSRYPGTTQAEARLLMQLGQCFLLPHRNEMTLAEAHRADHWLLTNTFLDPHGCRYFTLEVTVAPGNTPRAPGYVRWIQFRFHSWSNIQQAVQRPRLAGIGSILSRFERLEKIVLEYPGRVKECSVPACFKAVMSRMHAQSSSDARAYARTAERGGYGCDEFPISPCYLPVS